MASKSKTHFPGLVLKAASLPSNPETGTVARDTDGTLKQRLSGSWEAVGGGLTPVPVTSTGTVKANTVELCAIAASITRTLPPLPVSGEPVSWKIIDSGNADASKKITIAPASGEKFDRPGFVADDTVSIDYAGGWVAGYAEAGAAGWTIQTQATTTVSAGNLPGVTDGSTIVAPFIGQVITTTLTTLTQNSPTVSTYYDVPGTLTLPAGIWELMAPASLGIIASATPSGNQVAAGLVAIREGTNIISAGVAASASVNGALIYGQVNLSAVVNITGNTTYKISVAWGPGAGTPATPTSISLNAGYSRFYAKRIG